jgi:NADH-quinone oxidoreductase subunit G
VGTVWGTTVPMSPWRDTDGMLAAAASGDLGALVVAGVDLDDLADPAAAHAALRAAGFVVSLELRRSAVTELADVVLPVAPVVEKSGSFVTWEGRVRPFPQVLKGSNAIPDVRALAGIADELGRPLGFKTPEGAAAELDELGSWDGIRAADPELPTTETAERTPGQFRLATWKTMIGDGPMQDGDPAYHASGPTPTLLVSPATLEGLGVAVGEPVEVSTGRGALVLPVGVADLDDDVVWAPTSSGGTNLARDLGAGAGSVVSLAAAHGAVAEAGTTRGDS